MNKLMMTLFVSLCMVSAVSAGNYMVIDGIEGEVTLKGREGWIELQSFSWGIVSPRDAASGLPTGKRQHKPITIVKEIDKATPLLFMGCCQGTHIKEAKLMMYRTNNQGQEVLYCVITLHDVMISSFSVIDDDDDGDAATERIPSRPAEQLSFTYSSITVADPVSSKEYTDDWSTAR